MMRLFKHGSRAFAFAIVAVAAAFASGPAAAETPNADHAACFNSNDGTHAGANTSA